jgi:hypothetical protein
MREGTIFFPPEPLLELIAPLLEAQLVESLVVNNVHFQSLIASKAARCVDVTEGRRLVEFGLRRAHDGEAGLKPARRATWRDSTRPATCSRPLCTNCRSTTSGTLSSVLVLILVGATPR